jgi:Flp pilus assembly protein TadD
MNKCLFILALGTAAMAGPAVADEREIEYSEGALGFSAIMSGDYQAAEAQLATYKAHKDDPARLINHGFVLAKMGQRDQAAKKFQRAIAVDNVELILADGEVADSRDVAARALMSLQSGELEGR